jgi:phosphatidylglycerol:prolipoprotein diacylglycerol transferase
LVHPYQLMGLIVFSCAFCGFIGAKLFDILENIDAFWYNPIGTLLYTNGLTYYGGLIFGALIYLYIGYRHHIKQVHMADIGSPGMMLAYGIGRIGCQMAGDGDWGIVNTHPKPGWLHWLPDWMWSFRFPHNILDTGLPIKGCTGEHCFILPAGVYPTSFYEAVICISLFLLMWAFRRKIKIPGLMFSVFLILNGGERLLIEQIRVNTRYRVLGIAFTQAELICTLTLLGGIAGLIIIAVKRRKKARLTNSI